MAKVQTVVTAETADSGNVFIDLCNCVIQFRCTGVYVTDSVSFVQAVMRCHAKLAFQSIDFVPPEVTVQGLSDVHRKPGNGWNHIWISLSGQGNGAAIACFLIPFH